MKFIFDKNHGLILKNLPKFLLFSLLIFQIEFKFIFIAISYFKVMYTNFLRISNCIYVEVYDFFFMCL
jgi:hypothetical protein